MSTTPNQIEHLIANCRVGSTDDQWVLISKCRDYLLGIANGSLNRSLRAKASPSDLVEDTLLEAGRDFASFRGTTEDDLLRWLRRLLLNNVANFERDFLRRKKRDVTRERPLEIASSDHGGQILRAPGRTPSSEVASLEERAAVEAALERLPPDYRQVVILRNRDGLTFEQIGTELQRSADSCRRLWGRALLMLQSELEGCS
jgi:RNA polymerase sigma-70 factor, ECF subfamily